MESVSLSTEQRASFDLLGKKDFGVLRSMLAVVYDAATQAQCDEYIGAEPTSAASTATTGVTVCALGGLNTRAGSRDLEIPRARESNFKPTVIERSWVSGTKLVISDTHEGLKSAIGKVMQGRVGSAVRVHFFRNILAHAPQSRKLQLATGLKAVFSHARERTAGGGGSSRAFFWFVEQAHGGLRRRHRRCVGLPRVFPWSITARSLRTTKHLNERFVGEHALS